MHIYYVFNTRNLIFIVTFAVQHNEIEYLLMTRKDLIHKTVFFVIALLFIMCQSLHAQCEQKIYVCQYNGENEKTPLANVEVVVSNSGSTVSDANGMCTLRFRTLQPGDKVMVHRIEKPGYEVFNKEVVDQWFVSRDGSAFTIVMCKQETIEKLRAQYAKSATKELQKKYAFEENVIGKELKKGYLTKAQYEKKLDVLRNEYETKLMDINNYIDRLAHADLSTINQTERAVLELVKNGRILEALSQYEAVDLIAEYKREKASMESLSNAQQKIQEQYDNAEMRRAQLYQTVKRKNDLLVLAGGEENVEKGMKLLRDFAYTDTTYYQPLLEYAYLCLKTDRMGEAMQALNICQNAKDTIFLVRARMYNQYLKNKQRKYKEVAVEAKSLYEYCKGKSEQRHSPPLYLEERCFIIKTLYNALISLKDSAGVMQYLDPLLKEHHSLMELMRNNQSKRDYVEALSAAYRAMHTLFLKTRSEEAYNYLNSAIIIQEDLYREDPVKQAAMLGYLHSCYASHSRNVDKTNYEIADREYALSFQYYLEAYQKNPSAYAKFVAQNSLNRVAMYVYTVPQYYKKALPLLEQSKEFLRKGESINPTVMIPFYGFYERCASKYATLDGDLDGAVEHAEKAVDYYAQAFKESKSVYNDYIVAYGLLYNSLDAKYEAGSTELEERMSKIREKMIQLARENNQPEPEFK